MSKTIRIKLSNEEHREFLQFHAVIQGTGEDLQPLTQESLAKQCVFYAINDSRQRAARLMEQRAEEERRELQMKEYDVVKSGEVTNDTTGTGEVVNDPAAGVSTGEGVSVATSTNTANTTTNT